MNVQRSVQRQRSTKKKQKNFNVQPCALRRSLPCVQHKNFILNFLLSAAKVLWSSCFVSSFPLSLNLVHPIYSVLNDFLSLSLSNLTNSKFPIILWTIQNLFSLVVLTTPAYLFITFWFLGITTIKLCLVTLSKCLVTVFIFYF